MKKILTLSILVLFLFSVKTAYAVVPVTQIINGGTGTTTFNQGWLYSIGGKNFLAASSSPTVNYITATSTTATSTFSNGINAINGCFAVNGVCISGSGGGGSGTVTSITATSPLTGGTITTSGSIGCQTSSGSQAGCLSSTDWNTFNNKVSSTWSTLSSQVSGELINHPNNNTDIVAVGGNSTSTAWTSIDPNQQTLQIGHDTAPQYNAFGTGLSEVQINHDHNDSTGLQIYNKNSGTQATSYIALNNGNSSLGGPGAYATYSCNFVMGGSGWNQPAFASLPANGGALYCTDGPLILGSATSSIVSAINEFVGANSFFGGVPDRTLVGNTGNEGIATTSPWRRLSVGGGSSDLGVNALAGSFTATSTTATSTFAGGVSVGTTTTPIYYVNNGVFYQKVGSNQAMGTSTLSSGTVTVSNTQVKADSMIHLTLQNCSSCGTLSVGTIVAGTSFVINSTSGTDASKVLWQIIQPIY